MRATFVIALVLSASVLSAEAARTRIATSRTTTALGALPNAAEIQARVKEVDWSTDDAWIIFETDGITVTERASTCHGEGDFTVKTKPNPCVGGHHGGNPVTVPTWLDTLQGCAPRGKACFGVFKFNYLWKKDSSTKKGQSLLLYANDAPTIKKKLNNINGGHVVMGATMLWPKFKEAIVTRIPNAETDHPGKLTCKLLFDRFPSTNAIEEELFIKHCENMADDGSQSPDEGRPTSPDDDRPDIPTTPDEGHPTAHGGGGSDSPHGSSGGGGTVDVQQTEKLIQSAVKQAKAEMQQEIEQIATKTARSEVGQALLNLGSKTRDLGTSWRNK